MKPSHTKSRGVFRPCIHLRLFHDGRDSDLCRHGGRAGLHLIDQRNHCLHQQHGPRFEPSGASNQLSGAHRVSDVGMHIRDAARAARAFHDADSVHADVLAQLKQSTARNAMTMKRVLEVGK
jgi:hypothetical protein